MKIKLTLIQVCCLAESRHVAVHARKLSHDAIAGYEHGYIAESLLKKNILAAKSKFYVCGPPPMMDAIQKILSNLGVDDDSVVVEI